MKSILQVLVFFVAFLYLVPSAVLLCLPKDVKNPEVSSEPYSVYQSSTSYEHIKILDIHTNEVTEYKISDYIVASLMAQIPFGFEDEAILAQAILVNTYAIKRIELEEKSKTPELMGAHISNDISKYLPFYSKEQAEAMYKENYDRAYERFEAIAEIAKGYILCFEGEPITVAFHSISAGKTESALSAWGVGVEYLQSVDSIYDTQIQSFTEEKVITADEIKARLEQNFKEIILSQSPAEWLTIADKSENGYVRELLVGQTGVSISGAQLANAVNLRSPNFTISYSETANAFTFITRGGGHLVGMSQYGANAQAKEGKTASEILTHYFTGTEVLRVE